MNFISAQLPDNEDRRAEAVERTGLIDSNQASLFNIYCELAKDITGYEAVLFQLFDSKERCYLAEIQPEINETQNLNKSVITMFNEKLLVKIKFYVEMIDC